MHFHFFYLSESFCITFPFDFPLFTSRMYLILSVISLLHFFLQLCVISKDSHRTEGGTVLGVFISLSILILAVCFLHTGVCVLAGMVTAYGSRVASCRNDSIRVRETLWSLKSVVGSTVNCFIISRWQVNPSYRLIMQTWLRNNVMRFRHPAAVRRFTHLNVNICCFLAIC